MEQLRRAGVGVAVMSWYPAGRADDNGGTLKEARGTGGGGAGNNNHPNNREFDRLMMPVLDAAHSHGLEVAVHIEPYEGRDHMTVRNDLLYITGKCVRACVACVRACVRACAVAPEVFSSLCCERKYSYIAPAPAFR
jgi:hypothetical protein